MRVDLKTIACIDLLVHFTAAFQRPSLLQFPQIFQHVPTTLQEEPSEDGKHSQAVHRGAKESYTGAPNATALIELHKKIKYLPLLVNNNDDKNFRMTSAN